MQHMISQEPGLEVVRLCDRHPLLIAIAASALKVAHRDVKRWKRFSHNFTAIISKPPPPDVYEHRLVAAVEMNLTTLSPEARKAFLSFSAWPSSRLIWVRTELTCLMCCRGLPCAPCTCCSIVNKAG